MSLTKPKLPPTYVYEMSKKQYTYYFSDGGGGLRSKDDLINYINETYGLLGTCVDVTVTDEDE